MKIRPFFILTILLSVGSCLWISVFSQEREKAPEKDSSAFFIKKSSDYFDHNQSDSLKNIFSEFLLAIDQNPGNFPIDHWVKSCYDLAKKIYGVPDFELLTDILSPLLKIEPVVIDRDYYGEYGKLISIIATGYKRQGFSNESIEINLKALEYFNLCPTLETKTLPEFYLNLGNAFRDVGDFSQAYKYDSGALSQINIILSDQTLDESTREYFLKRKASSLNSMGLSYEGLGKHKEALVSFSESIEISDTLEPSKLPMLNNNIGFSYSAIGENEKALSHYQKSLAFFEKPESYDKFWVRYTLNYSDLLILMKDSAKAETIVKQILLYGPEISGVTDVQMATAYFQMGTIDSQNGRFQNSVTNMDIGLSQITGIKIAKDADISMNEISLANSPFKVIQGIKFRARTFKEWGDSEKSQDKYLTALGSYELAELCIDSLRANLDSEESKINLSRLEKETYSEKIEILWKIYSMTPSAEILAKAFKTVEKGKASGLWSLIQLSDNKRELLPLEIVKEEKKLKDEIASYDNEILPLDISDPALKDSLKTQRFLIARKLDSLNNMIKSNYPDYNKAIFKNEVISLDEITKSLSNDQVIIQYFFSDNFLHQIFVSSDTVSYLTIPNPVQIIEQLDSFIRKLHQPVHDYSKKDVAEYQASAWNLYKILIDPFENLMFRKELIILPDENLSLLPFEALVTAEGLSSKSDFGDLKYLLNQNIISYSFNASMWAYQKPHTKHVSKAIFGFAPNYNVTGLDTSSFWKSKKSLIPFLPGTLEEIKLLKKDYKGHTFFGIKATEKKFKEKVADYRILHLAMHSLTLDNNLGNTSLVFTPFADDEEDGLLYSNEIRNLNINADLTILSACKTGTGELAAGEGVLSLSRMFLLAGSSSVLMTLWSVDDNSSKGLMKDFYNYLAQDKSVSEALRLSKLTFLKDASKLHSHPFFWSGFIHLGRDNHIQLNRKIKPWQIYSGGIILLGLIIFLTLKYTKSQP